MSHQYFAGIEQQLGSSNTFLSVAYVGTTGRDLLRFTTPNLGSNYILRVNEIGTSCTERTAKLLFKRADLARIHIRSLDVVGRNACGQR